MINTQTPLAFVDIETTGNLFDSNEIIEIAIIRVENDKTTTFQQLFKPTEKIPRFIERLTGITNQKVVNQPKIESYLDDIQTILQDAIFIAHDVAFDFNFIQYLFQKNNRQLNNTLLCTYQLAKMLYPEDKKHGVDFLVEKHQLQIANRHRAYSDALAIYQFWSIIHQEFPTDTLNSAIQNIMKNKDANDKQPLNESIKQKIKRLPKNPGVLMLLGRDKKPLLIKKTNNIQHQVKNYYQEYQPHLLFDLRQIHKIKIYPAQSIFTKHLIELKLRQKYTYETEKPPISYSISLHHRKNTSSNNHTAIHLSISPTEFTRPFYALYKSSDTLHRKLLELVNQHTDFIQQYHKGIHFSSIDEVNQIQPDSIEHFNQELLDILSGFTKFEWPYQNPVYYAFGNDYYVFTNWQFLACIPKSQNLENIEQHTPISLDKATINQLKNQLNQLVKLP